jgi:hypothetical protein
VVQQIEAAWRGGCALINNQFGFGIVVLPVGHIGRTLGQEIEHLIGNNTVRDKTIRMIFEVGVFLE